VLVLLALAPLAVAQNLVQDPGFESPTYVVIIRSLDKHFKTGLVRVQIDSVSSLPPPSTYAQGGLRAGTRYYYRIYEGNKYGLSPFTTAVSILGSGLEVDYVTTLMSEAQEQVLRATR
jgi:hypothetical protein